LSRVYFNQSCNRDNLESFLNSIEESSAVLFIAEKSVSELAELDSIIKKSFKNIIGGLFPFVIYKDKYLDQGMVAFGIDSEIEIAEIDNLSEGEEFIEQLEEFADRELSGETNLLFVDGLSKNIGGFIDEIYNVMGDQFKFIGGGAGSLSFKQSPVIITPNGLCQDCAVVLNLNMKSFIGVSHGWESISGPHQITKSSKNVIEELDYHPAFDVYREILKKRADVEIDETNFFDIAKGFPFGINKLGSEKVVRDPIVVDGKSLICVGDVVENDYVDILKGDNSSLIGATESSKEKSLMEFKEVQREGEAVSLFIDCVSRVLYLEDEFQREIDAVQIENIPLFGVLTLGEIANSGDNYLEFYNKTSVFSILAR
jgi:hypothetical protein